MPPAAANEKEGKELGTPQTPAGGLRPPAPPAQASPYRATHWVLPFRQWLKLCQDRLQ